MEKMIIIQFHRMEIMLIIQFQIMEKMLIMLYSYSFGDKKLIKKLKF